MRLVATSDTHSPVDPKKIPDGDVFVHAGDIMTTGYLDEWRWAVEWLAALPHKVKLFVPGNHDFHMQVYPGPALQDMRRAGVTVVGLPGNNDYTSCLLPNGKRLLGLPQVTNLPRWAFSSTEAELADYLSKLPDYKYDIVVSHAPVYGYLDVSGRTGTSVGNRVYPNFLADKKPELWIHGHIHEGYGHVKVDGCDIYNVAMSDRKSRHANAPIVLDI
jgi:calcineurin-like phosphoesterase family protein